MPLLVNVPSGTSLFIDANCLLYHFLGTRPVCTSIVHRSEIGDLYLVTSVVIVGEVRHRLMILEAAERFRLPPRRVLGHLKQHPNRIHELRTCVEAVKSLYALRVTILPLSAELLLASQRFSEEFGLLTNDAILIATMRAARVTHLASNDTDFDRVPGMIRWRP